MNYKRTSNEDLETANDNLIDVYEQPFSIKPKMATLAECSAIFDKCMAAAGESDLAKAACMSNYRACVSDVKTNDNHH